MLALALAVVLGAQDPVAHWAFDSDAAERRHTALDGKPMGKVGYVESPVGAKGHALVLSGIDAAVQISPPKTLGAGSADFTISLWICPLELRDAVLLSRPGAWTLRGQKDGSLSFEVGDRVPLRTPSRTIQASRWFHLAICIHRGGAGRGSALVVNGTTSATGEVKAGDLDPAGVPLVVGWAPGEKVFFCGLVDDLRLYAADLEFRTLEGIADDGIPWIRDWARARTGFQGGFQLDPNDVVVTAGGEDALAGALDSTLEAVLLESAGPQRVLFRSMAWEGDTVYEQPRLLNFGSWRDQLSKVGAGVLLARFGAVEALEGRKAIDRFEKAYDRLLGEFSESTRRIVVVTPVPFEKPPGSMPDLSPRNDDLRLFVAVMKRLAEKRRLLFVDLFGATWSGPLTRDGIHLSDGGHAAVAQEIARQLGLQPRAPSAELLSALRKKNREWLQYWRPTNWAFLNGDRVEQPSSRDHVDRRIRWFPVEVEERLALVRRDDAAIEALLEGKR